MIKRKVSLARSIRYCLLILMGVLSVYLLTGCGVSSPGGSKGYVQGYLYKQTTRSTGETVNMPIADAVIQQSGTSNRATTNEKGYFSLYGDAGYTTLKVTKSVSGAATMLGFFDIRIDRDTTRWLDPLIIQPEFDVISITDADYTNKQLRSLKRTDALKNISPNFLSAGATKALSESRDIGETPYDQWFEVVWSGTTPTQVLVGDELYDPNPVSYNVESLDISRGYKFLLPSGATAGKTMYFSLVDDFGTEKGPMKSTPMAAQNLSDELSPSDGEWISQGSALGFSWKTIPGAKYYYVRVYSISASGILQTPITSSSPIYNGLSWSYPGNLPSGDYAWWVVAVNDDNSAISLGKMVKFHIY